MDLEAAARAGVKHLIHVRTGHGASERARVIGQFPQAELVNSLADIYLDDIFKGTAKRRDTILAIE